MRKLTAMLFLLGFYAGLSQAKRETAQVAPSVEAHVSAQDSQAASS